MPPRRRLVAIPADPPREPAPDLRESVRSMLDTMTWLTDADAGMKALALRLADEIEQARDRAAAYASIRGDAGAEVDILKRLRALQAHCDATKSVGWLGPQLQGVLRDLGGSPAARRDILDGKPAKNVGSRIAQLRAAATRSDDS